MRYLILTSSGGGAHLVYAGAQKNSLLKKNISEQDIYIVDIMGVNKKIANNSEPWVPSYEILYYQIFSGSENVNKWDSFQKEGGMSGVAKLESLIDKQYFAEKIQASSIYSNLMKLFKQYPDIEEIIDTQALSTDTICHAVSAENERRKNLNSQAPLIKVRKIISEFLTEKTVHYLDSLSRITVEQAKFLTVEVVNKPLINADESEEHFKKRKKIYHINFKIVPPYVRPLFLDSKSYKDPEILYLRTEADDSFVSSIKEPLTEQAYVENLLESEAHQENRHFKITKQANDKFAMIVLGSQSSSSILRYVDQYIEQVIRSKLDDKGRQMLFIAAGKNDGSTETVYAKLREHLDRKREELNMAGISWPKTAKIIPLSFQDEKAMASMFQNVDQLIIRTGGATSIEAEVTQELNPKRRVYIHSEASVDMPELFPKEHFDACYDSLLKGTIRWEGGNGQYLMQDIDACLTSPETILFDLEGQSKKLTFKESLVELTYKNKLNRKHMNEIKQCLAYGSNPNMSSFAGLPILAHVQDIYTARLFIQCGGYLTPKVLNCFKSKFSEKNINNLKRLEEEVSAAIKTQGAPSIILSAFIKAIEKNNINGMKGLLLRYPKLAFATIENNKKKISILELAKQQNNKESLWIIQRAQGMSLLHYSLLNAKPSDSTLLQHLIYLYQEELNKNYTYKVTALTLCKDVFLRKLMVQLGANPVYLASDISEQEKQELKKIYAENKIILNQLKKLILTTFIEHKKDEHQFSVALKLKLQALSFSLEKPCQVPDKLFHHMFIELNKTEHEVDKLSFIERIISEIKKFIFGAYDLTIYASRAQAKKLLFYQCEFASQNNESNFIPFVKCN